MYFTMYKSRLKGQVLVLNQNYEPMSVCDVRRAIILIYLGKAEVIEFSVEENTHIPGMKIHNLHMPENSLILSINRDKEDIIPDGNFEFKAGDTVIAIVKKESVKRLEENL